MRGFQPRGLATAIGSMPHQDAHEACALVLRCLPDVPVWPQLPNRSQRENMYVQYFERFPGAIVADGKVVVERGERLDLELEQLYADYLEGRFERYALAPDVAAGLATMQPLWRGLPRPPLFVKGQLTGPISAGLQITDLDLRPVLYDEVLADALAKYLRLVALAHERALREACEQTIVFLDEPFLSAVGSAFIQIRRDQAVELLSEVLGGLHGLKGIHCCGNTDWSLVLAAPIDVLSFDAYDFAETLALYAGDVAAFLGRGGTIAWGIVPTNQSVLESEDAVSLGAKLAGAIDLLVSRGIDRDMILRNAWITPSCGLTPLTTAGAGRALALTTQVAGQIRGRFAAK